MTPMATDLTRDSVVDALADMDLDWADEEDATVLVDLLLQRFSPLDAITWLVWVNVDLDGRSPLIMLRDGRSRDVFALARREVGAV